MTEAQVIEGIELCLKKVDTLLTDAKTIVDHNKGDKSAHAFGLYTFAVEEFGKALLLKECHAQMQPNNDVKVPAWIFAKGTKAENSRSHSEKIGKAFGVLPFECVHINMGMVISKPANKTRAVKLTQGRMTIPEALTGYISYMAPAGVDARLRCFYVDWDLEGKEWQYEINATNNDLIAAIGAFHEYLGKNPLI